MAREAMVIFERDDQTDGLVHFSSIAMWLAVYQKVYTLTSLFFVD